MRQPTPRDYNASESAAQREELISKPYALHQLLRIQRVLDQHPAGLIIDIDGTIAPITPTPDETQVSPLCRSALATLTSSMALVAVLSGRGALKAREMLAVDGVVYVGNHGLDRWRDGKLEIAEEAKEYQSAIQRLENKLRQDLDMPGLIVEDKGISVGIHYRLSHEPRRARETILRILGNTLEAQGLIVTEGKLVVEVRPPTGVDKGTSLRQLVTEYGLKGVICLGDDVTDVDAFKAVHALSSQGRCKGLALGVLGQNTPPDIEQEADLLLRGVPEVEELLQRIAKAYPSTAPAPS
ncbi:MAG: trehalose-phosphatase [Chloroflexota bacterium]